MILVTGGTGLVGSHLLYDLTKSGKRVRALKRRESNIHHLHKVFSYYTSSAAEQLKLIDWVDADLLDIHSLLEIMNDVSFIYHCAAMVSFEPKHEEMMRKINIEGTTNMVNAAIEKGVKKFCFVSSIAALGKAKNENFISENELWKYAPDISNYSLSKYSSEREVWRASEEGLDVIIVNPSLIIGGGNWTQSSSNIFTKNYREIKFYTEGATGFVDVRDVSAIMILLMNSSIKNQRYILNSENMSYKTVFDLICHNFGKEKSSIKAGKLLSEFAWRTEKVRSFFTNKPPLITKETSISAHKKNKFSNEKFLKLFPDYNYIPIKKSLKDTCDLFLKDLKAN